MNDKWTKYHETRRSLIESIKSHINSIEDVNVYNNHVIKWRWRLAFNKSINL
jgi:hypothetical protein